ncbi:thymidine kinase [Craterilacuibacter sp. RT1T]|uniref:thymidine kinase n=1 Tax=Craterilacuibacter sp. RT1T TaxID=2942211 RepID=UPI0020C0DE13|nr:thymidine kinase [Craterilacuibacter sp. RT1T]MCL6263187.1 thymidine kinase [Craterilacuibacter sp. RT1T]
MAKLFFRHAAMNSGKSTQLLQIAHNYEDQGRRVCLFTAAIDGRFGAGQIASRLGVSRSAAVFDANTRFDVQQVGAVDCVLIDEAQFLAADQVRQLHRLAHVHDIPVIAFGLRSDFLGEPFPGAAWLLALAEDIEEIKTICLCGRKATMHLRIDANGQRLKQGPQVEIGDTGRYRSVCARCFYTG